MKYVQALVSVALFGWLGFALLTDSVPGGEGGSGKTRKLKSIMESATQNFGVENTAYLCFGIGVLLAILFLLREE